MNGVLCLTEDEINKIVEKKMEKIIEKYDRKIALLEEKIHAQDVKIQILEKKCSTPALSAEKESASLKHVTSDHRNDTDTQRKTHDNHIRIVPGTVNWYQNLNFVFVENFGKRIYVTKYI